MRSEKSIPRAVPSIPRISPENKVSALVDRNGLPLACTVTPANVHESQLYEPTMEAFEIPGVPDHLEIISTDPAYDSRETCQYNQKRGIKSNIPVDRSPEFIQREEGHSGSIQNYIRSAVRLNGASAGSRYSRRSLSDMNAMSSHFSD